MRNLINEDIVADDLQGQEDSEWHDKDVAMGVEYLEYNRELTRPGSLRERSPLRYQEKKGKEVKQRKLLTRAQYLEESQTQNWV